MTNMYIERMAELSRRGFDDLFAGITEVIFTDFPDYPNVGDSAIALGTLEYFDRSAIKVAGTYCMATLPNSVLEATIPVYINGGGNIAGLYPLCDSHRYTLSEQLREATPLVQGPQTLHFSDDLARADFTRKFAHRRDVKIAVRDNNSLSMLSDIDSSIDSILMPDAVHMLGAIASPPPVRPVVFMNRADGERADSSSVTGVDWLKDHRLTWFECSLRWRSARHPYLASRINPSVKRWRQIANRRLRRGVNLLSPGEVIVTDRLHAMLIGLQMGRSVIAVDNNNHKLSKYADTWFGSTSPDVRFARSFAEAQEMCR